MKLFVGDKVKLLKGETEPFVKNAQLELINIFPNGNYEFKLVDDSEFKLEDGWIITIPEKFLLSNIESL